MNKNKINHYRSKCNAKLEICTAMLCYEFMKNLWKFMKKFMKKIYEKEKNLQDIMIYERLWLLRLMATLETRRL